MTAPQNPRVAQADYDLLRLLDVPATADHLLMAAHHREAAEAASKAREAALVETADKIEALIPMPGNDRQMNGTYAQGVFDALQIVRAALTKEPDA